MAPLSKANGFNSFVAALRELLTPAQWEQLYASLSANARALIDRPPMGLSWIDDGLWIEVHVRLRMFDGHLALVTEAARRQLQRDLSTVYKVLMHLVSPDTVVRKAATLYGTYTKNGRMTAQSLGDNRFEVAVRDVEDSVPETWHFHVGTITGTLQSAGAEDIAVAFKETGHDYCVYEVTWR